MVRVTARVLTLMFFGIACTQRPTAAANPAVTPDALKSEIEALKVARVAWREIAWKSCLLEGLRESRAKSKPLLLWIFIDRPADDERC